MIEQPAVDFYDDLCDFYEELHPGREKEFEFYGALVTHPGIRVLDVACGTGEISVRLAQRGARVTGLDASAAMLARARQRSGSVQWLLGDMRTIQQPECYDLAVCGLNSLQHLETDVDLVQALTRIRDHLAPGGWFAFDVFNPSDVFLSGPRHNVLMRRFFSACAGCEVALYEDTAYDDERQLLHVTWRIVDAASGRPLAGSRSTMRQIFPAALDALLAASGFVASARYGDFDQTPFAPDHAKQIVLARKL
ncbi:class I SAM-dependent methyltransferase [Bradyrhizobium sp. HKCCYLS3013]|uniref:class I SAM-dependent methyltransferase n=1 Tax=Bradyrhizobium sp. HKCCYLS3013 TaxID=3420735 RepID=UPI003EC082BD